MAESRTLAAPLRLAPAPDSPDRPSLPRTWELQAVAPIVQIRSAEIHDGADGRRTTGGGGRKAGGGSCIRLGTPSDQCAVVAPVIGLRSAVGSPAVRLVFRPPPAAASRHPTVGQMTSRIVMVAQCLLYRFSGQPRVVCFNFVVSCALYLRLQKHFHCVTFLPSSSAGN